MSLSRRVVDLRVEELNCGCERMVDRAREKGRPMTQVLRAAAIIDAYIEEHKDAPDEVDPVPVNPNAGMLHRVFVQKWELRQKDHARKWGVRW